MMTTWMMTPMMTLQAQLCLPKVRRYPTRHHRMYRPYGLLQRSHAWQRGQQLRLPETLSQVRMIAPNSRPTLLQSGRPVPTQTRADPDGTQSATWHRRAVP